MSKEIPKNAPGGVPPENQYADEDAAMAYLPESTSESAGQLNLEAVLQRHERVLMAIDGVLGVGAGRTLTGDDGIILYVRDASVKSRVPAHVEGFPVETTVTGEIDAYPLAPVQI